MINSANPQNYPKVEPAYRLFIALHVPESIRAAIHDAQESLRVALRPGAVRWTPASQFHLTLRFLGDVAIERVEELCRSIEGACAGFGELELMAGQVGCFPNLRRPRVVWVGVHDATNRLLALHLAIEAGAREFSTERPETKFTGHITLGRVKELSRIDARVLAAGIAVMADRRFGVWQGGAVELIRSKLSAAGAEYSLVGSFPLSRGD